MLRQYPQPGGTAAGVRWPSLLQAVLVSGPFVRTVRNHPGGTAAGARWASLLEAVLVAGPLLASAEVRTSPPQLAQVPVRLCWSVGASAAATFASWHLISSQRARTSSLSEPTPLGVSGTRARSEAI